MGSPSLPGIIIAIIHGEGRDVAANSSSWTSKMPKQFRMK
jgi:hypothetical protein